MTSQANGATKSSRFELPALNLDFGNITDGTNIPPPPDSPIRKEPTPPQTPIEATKDSDEAAVPANGTKETPKSNEGQAATTGAPLAPRPQSQGGASLLDDRNKSKRSSSWFKRFRSSDQPSRRSSVLITEVRSPATPKAPAGPPPPMIPELTEFNKDEGSLGTDLFKNIK